MENPKVGLINYSAHGDNTNFFLPGLGSIAPIVSGFTGIVGSYMF
jgi:hypothetical protein